MTLAGGLKHARLSSFREHNPFGMPLQLLDDTSDKSHGRLSNPARPKLQRQTGSDANCGSQSETPSPAAKWTCAGRGRRSSLRQLYARDDCIAFVQAFGDFSISAITDARF